jgi:hypothetical protein
LFHPGAVRFLTHRAAARRSHRFVECKSPGKAPRADQLREHERLRALGFNVVALDSKDLSDIL